MATAGSAAAVESGSVHEVAGAWLAWVGAEQESGPSPREQKKKHNRSDSNSDLITRPAKSILTGG